MKTTQSPKYLCFELFLINDIKNRLPEIAAYSVAKYAHKLEIPLYKLVPQISELVKKRRIVNLTFVKYYYEHIYVSKSDEDNINLYYLAEASNLSISDDYGYRHFIADGQMYGKINAALHDLELVYTDYNFLIKTFNKISKEVRQFESLFNKDALVMLSVEMALDYLKNDKPHRDWELLRGFLAIKSLQGSKSMVATHKADIQQRMVGAKSEKVLNQFLNDKSTKVASKKLYKKFTGRYFGDQLIKDLFHKRFIQSKITPRGSRVIYLSTSLTMGLLAQEILSYKTKPTNSLKDQEALMRDKISKESATNQPNNRSRHLQLKHIA